MIKIIIEKYSEVKNTFLAKYFKYFFSIEKIQE